MTGGRGTEEETSLHSRCAAQRPFESSIPLLRKHTEDRAVHGRGGKGGRARVLQIAGFWVPPSPCFQTENKEEGEGKEPVQGPASPSGGPGWGAFPQSLCCPCSAPSSLLQLEVLAVTASYYRTSAKSFTLPALPASPIHKWANGSGVPDAFPWRWRRQ